MSSITPMLSNEELAQAIAATQDMLKNTHEGKSRYPEIEKHFIELLAAQRKRAQVMYCEAIGE